MHSRRLNHSNFLNSWNVLIYKMLHLMVVKFGAKCITVIILKLTFFIETSFYSRNIVRLRVYHFRFPNMATIVWRVANSS